MSTGVSVSLSNMQSAIRYSTAASNNSDAEVDAQVDSDRLFGSGISIDIVQEERRQEAYDNIFDARVVLTNASSTISRIGTLLADIQTKATTAADSDTTTTERAALVVEINDIAERINSRIANFQYEENPLLDGTYSGENRLSFITGLTTNVDTLLPNYIDLQSESDNIQLAEADEDTGSLTVQFNGEDLTDETEELIFSKFENEVAKAIELIDTKNDETTEVADRLDTRVERLADTVYMDYRLDDLEAPQTTMQKLVEELNTNPMTALQVQGNISLEGFVQLLNSNE